MQKNNNINQIDMVNDHSPTDEAELLYQAIKEASSKIQSGMWDCHIEVDLHDPALKRIAGELNNCLQSIGASIGHLTQDITKLALCEFDYDLKTKKDGPLGNLNQKLFTTTSNLNEALRQMYDFNSSITKTSNDIAERNVELSGRTQQQAESLDTTKHRMEQLAITVGSNSENAQKASAISQDTNHLATSGGEAVQKMVASMNSIKQSTTRIQGITGMIKDLAFQTNILSLNAAVEAARAGEQGRGFSVVANEVRSLATRCADAVKDIDELITESTDLVDTGETLAQDAEQKMTNIAEGIKKTSDLMGEITVAAQQQAIDIKETKDEIRKLDAFTQENNTLVEILTNSTSFLDQQTAFMQDAMNVFAIRKSGTFTHPGHIKIQEVAVETANQIGELFNQAVRQGFITEEELFDTEYIPIAGTNPQKYTTRFDHKTDQLLPQLQEPILEKYKFVIFAGAVDKNGYFPTHNKKCCQPLTGDYKTDLLNNRTKRIFSDRVGLSCCSHTDPGKLQVYRRDTGELMFDMSAPIYACGKQWGGFRIGYRFE